MYLFATKKILIVLKLALKTEFLHFLEFAWWTTRDVCKYSSCAGSVRA